MDSFILPTLTGSSNNPITPQMLQARARMAQAMMQQGNEATPTTALGALARAMQGGIGGYMMNKVGGDWNTANQGYRQRLANALNTGSPTDMAAVVSDPFGDPSVAMQLPGLVHNQATWAAQNRIASGQGTPGDYATAYPQQSGDLWEYGQKYNMGHDRFLQQNGMGTGQSQAAPMPSAQPQPGQPAFAPLPGSPEATALPQSPQAPQMSAQGQPQQPPIQNAAQPPAPPANSQGQQVNENGVPLDAQGYPMRPITDPNQIKVPDDMMQQFADLEGKAPGEGVKAKQLYQQSQMEKLNALYDKGPEGSAIANQAKASGDMDTAKAKVASGYLENRDNNFKRLEMLRQLDDLYTRYGNQIFTGKGAEAVMQLKQGLVNAGLVPADTASPTELLNKLGTKLATVDTTSMGSREAAQVLQLMRATNAGLSMSTDAGHKLVRAQMRDAERQLYIGDQLWKRGYGALPDIVNEYDSNPKNSIMAIMGDKPLDDTPQSNSGPHPQNGAAIQGNDPLSQARAAIAAGADPAKVRARLQQNGIDPSGL